MRKRISRVIVVVNSHKEEACRLLQEVRSHLQRMGAAVTVLEVEEGKKAHVEEGADLAITLGGDGTLLYGARLLAHAGIPMLAVNLGDFGFITEVSRLEWVDALEKYADGRLGLSRRIMFDAQVVRAGRRLDRFTGLNDAVIRAGDFARIIVLRIHLSGTYVARYRADGVIVATPTGSTAYSMSAGGPILHPEMEAFILNPICPFTLSNRPIVIPATELLEIEVEGRQRTGIVLVVDGQEAFRLEPGDRVFFRRADRYCSIILSDKRSFYEVLRAKLNWAGEPHA
jgi:NAD+ kinase